jgi:predicted nucleic acid-binding Zn ribbon protein
MRPLRSSKVGMSTKQGVLFTPDLRTRTLMRRAAKLPGENPARRFRRPDPLRGVVSAIVLGGLNAGMDTRAAVGTSVSLKDRERVSQLIELLQRAHSLLQTPTEKSRKECEGLLGELNTLSQRYKWSTAYVVSETGLGLSWQFPDPENWEDISVWWIRRLVETHAIHKLRQCLHCQVWFYAVTQHQRFCSENCRKKHASKSPVFKEKRRRYMAEVYRPYQKKEEERLRRLASRPPRRNP